MVGESLNKITEGEGYNRKDIIMALILEMNGEDVCNHQKCG